MKNTNTFQKNDSLEAKKLQDKLLGKKLIRYPVLLLVVFSYLYIGFQYNIWHPTWVILLIIPFYYQIVITLLRPKLKRKLLFIPILTLASSIYLYLGLEHKLWHPSWLIFILALAIIWPLYNSDTH